MMADKLKERQQATEGSEVPPPSPPQRHEIWKRARVKLSGEYTSEDTRLVAEKIVSSFTLFQILTKSRPERFFFYIFTRFSLNLSSKKICDVSVLYLLDSSALSVFRNSC